MAGYDLTGTPRQRGQRFAGDSYKFIEMLIYKYMPTERFFTNFKLRFTPPDDLNDPLELVPHVRIVDPEGYARNITERNIESLITRFQIEHPDVPPEEVRARCTWAAEQYEKTLDTMAKEREHFDSFMKVTNEFVGVLSLTTAPTNAAMWAHYADMYKGLAVGFDSESNFFRRAKGEPKQTGELMQVSYTNTPPIAYVEPGKINYPPELFFTKAKCWEYEQEWRMIKYLPNAQDVIERSGGRPIHLFDVPPDTVKEVVFGFKMSPEARAVVEAALAERAPHVAKKKIEFVPNFGLQVMDC
ncbi:DUF2971 domain-containing protein [Burkholderia ubonensis]|uniref:DUF2971 domain-containing protein n=1 Tax=Burkholderia ubonensis TaxID=101571 RepID=UPI000A606465|nr:DUF2971 domain-containing protein [Burkholderia ubonensis]